MMMCGSERELELETVPWYSRFLTVINTGFMLGRSGLADKGSCFPVTVVRCLDAVVLGCRGV